jgi:membrane-anchored protein YejM (alkaline phosphatase superfamily)
MSERDGGLPVNYIYFGFLFLALAALQVYHVLLIGTTSPFTLEVYVTVAVLESFIEVAVLSWISTFLLKRRLKTIHWIYICAITLLFFMRVADFAVVRLMDVSAWRWIELIFQETFTNFVEMLYATNVKLSMWILSFFVLMAVVALSCFLFFLTNKLCHKRPWIFSSKKAIAFCLLGFLAVGATEVFLYVTQVSHSSFQYSKALPWKRTLLDAKEEIIEVKGYLKDPQTSSFQLSQMDSNSFSLERKPDIFLFVVESLRDDFLTESVTPNLVQFRSQNHHLKNARSISNATHKTWFSLFYSMYPFYWTRFQPKQWDQGGLPLALLKKMGYETHVYASSRLNYYQMDETLFGKNTNLIDHLHEFRVDESLSASETDTMAIEKLCNDIQGSEQKGGRVFITFLDSTHFDYSWPKSKVPKFLPIEDKIDYLEVICGRNRLDTVRNRYRNSIHFIDELFSKFEESMKANNAWDDSVVVFTADHGEEFDEFGCVFHASGLSLPQLQIPLYVKLGGDQTGRNMDNSRVASQIDIFPTIFHYLVGEDFLSPLFQGESLLAEPKRNYVIGARYNASQLPSEFYIQKDSYRMVVEFCNPKDIFHSRFLKVKSIVNDREEKIPFSSSFIQSHFGDALDNLFSLP